MAKVARKSYDHTCLASSRQSRYASLAPQVNSKSWRRGRSLRRRPAVMASQPPSLAPSPAVAAPISVDRCVVPSCVWQVTWSLKGPPSRTSPAVAVMANLHEVGKSLPSCAVAPSPYASLRRVSCQSALRSCFVILRRRVAKSPPSPRRRFVIRLADRLPSHGKVAVARRRPAPSATKIAAIASAAITPPPSLPSPPSPRVGIGLN
jgi:hypothetical protein